MRNPSIAALMLATGLALVSGCSNTADQGSTASAAALSEVATPSILPAGAQLRVRLSSNLTSETAQVGDPWSGTLAAALVIGDREVLPAGTPVRGSVTGAHPAGLGTRAMLDLVVQDVSVAGAAHELNASTDAILADLPSASSSTSSRATTAMAGAPSDRVMPAEKGAEVVLGSGAELVFIVREHAQVQ